MMYIGCRGHLDHLIYGYVIILSQIKEYMFYEQKRTGIFPDANLLK